MFNLMLFCFTAEITICQTTHAVDHHPSPAPKRIQGEREPEVLLK